MGSKIKIVKLGDLYLEPSRNGLTKPKKIRGRGYKFINMGEIFEFDRMLNIPCDRAPLSKKEAASSLLQRSDLLFARQSLVLSGAGKCSIFLGDNEPVTFESHLIRVRLDQAKVIPEYIYYFFKSPQGRAEMGTIIEQGAGQAGIRGSDLAGLKVFFPSILQQQLVTKILSSLDDKIELNRQMNATLESMAQAMFKSWFVDFDPVIDNALAAGNPIPEPLKAKAEARKALGDKRKPLPQEIQELFPSRFVFTEELGWIPEGWEVSTIGDQVNTAGGGTPSTKDDSYWAGGVHAFCTPKDMSRLNSIILTDTERHLTDAGVNKIASGQLEAGVVLMSSRAPIGYLAISNIPVSVNQGIIAMIPSEKYGSMYLHLWAYFNMEQITDRANGSTFMEISKKNFRPIPFLVPEDKILKYFNEQSHSIYLKLLSLSENIVELTNLRDTLLPKLISGQLRLPDSLIDKFAEQADSHDSEQSISEAI
ncbi:restriction endonuclease subunit S [Desulfonatronospira sp.]|uniref:restriction endonuclease subunit S n=1 Tax=Desulfonatronospira sp. TaxID=1962951 RepID=UPI0025C27443|nr:restriction endonuclease subunit S [Desulfonatronospira sp.]